MSDEKEKYGEVFDILFHEVVFDRKSNKANDKLIDKIDYDELTKRAKVDDFWRPIILMIPPKLAVEIDPELGRMIAKRAWERVERLKRLHELSIERLMERNMRKDNTKR